MAKDNAYSGTNRALRKEGLAIIMRSQIFSKVYLGIFKKAKSRSYAAVLGCKEC